MGSIVVDVVCVC